MTFHQTFLVLALLYVLHNVQSVTIDQRLLALKTEGSLKNAGLIARLDKKGIDYINNHVSAVMAETIPLMNFESILVDLTGEMKGRVRLSDIRITKYEAPKTFTARVLRPNVIRWYLNDMDVSTISRGTGIVTAPWQLDINGDFLSHLEQASITLDVAFDRTSRGKLNIRAQSCSISSQKRDIQVQNAGAIDFFFNLLKPSLLIQLKPVVDKSICDVLTSVFDKLNRRLNSIPSVFTMQEMAEYSLEDLLDIKVRVGRQVTPQTKESISEKKKLRGAYDNRDWRAMIDVRLLAAILWTQCETCDLFQQLMLFFIDLSIHETPLTVKNKFIQFPFKGQCFGDLNNRTQSPFLAPYIAPSSGGTSNRMAEIVITDYSINTLLDEAQSLGFFNIVMDRQSPNVGHYMRTSCDTGRLTFCVGDLLDELVEQHPNKDVAILLLPARAPAVYFTDEGKINVLAQFLAVISVTPTGEQEPKTPVLAVSIESVAVVTPYFNITSRKLFGEMEIETFDMQVRLSRLDGLSKGDVLESSAEWTRIYVEQYMNGFLEDGFPIPIGDFIKLNNSEVVVKKRRMELYTDFELNEELVKRVIRKAMID